MTKDAYKRSCSPCFTPVLKASASRSGADTTATARRLGAAANCFFGRKLLAMLLTFSGSLKTCRCTVQSLVPWRANVQQYENKCPRSSLTSTTFPPSMMTGTTWSLETAVETCHFSLEPQALQRRSLMMDFAKGAAYQFKTTALLQVFT